MKSRSIYLLSLAIIVVVFATMFIPLWSVERIVFKGEEAITSVSTYNVLKVASDRSIFYDEFKFVTPLSIAFVVISFVCAITMAIIGIMLFGEERKRILKIVGVSSASILSIIFLVFMIISFVAANSYSFLETSAIQKGTGLGEISFILIFVMCFVYSFFLLRDPFKSRTKKIIKSRTKK